MRHTLQILLALTLILAAIKPAVAAGDAGMPAAVNLDGAAVDLTHLPKGCRAVVLTFATLDCPISNTYAPVIGDLYRAFSPRGILFYVVYSDSAATAGAAAAHHHDFAYPCGGLLDPDLALARYLQVKTTAAAVVFDADGKVLYRGAIDDQYAAVGKRRTEARSHYLADALDAVIAGRSVKNSETKAVGCALETK